jgi:Na+/proline symporter
VGTGPGLVLILRWYWWRINAWAELSAMVAGFVVGAGTTLVPVIRIDDFGLRLFVTAFVTVAIWVPVMFLTRPEPDAKLDEFYRRVRPGGPGWRRQRERTGLPPAQDLGHDLQRVCAGLLLLFGLMFGIGSVVLLRWAVLVMMVAMAVAGAVWLKILGRPEEAPALPEPATHPS